MQTIRRKYDLKLKGLYKQRELVTDRLKRFSKDKEILDGNIREQTTKLHGIQKGIDHLEDRKLLISTHFILRYNERVKVASEDEIRGHIITPQFENMVRTLGNGTYPVEEYMIVVEDNKLLTILIPGSKEERKERKKRYITPGKSRE